MGKRRPVTDLERWLAGRVKDPRNRLTVVVVG